jgi:hypothetical protein
MTTPAAAEAARRAWTLLNIADRRSRENQHPAEKQLVDITEFLAVAITSLREDPSPDDNPLPADADLALADADCWAGDYPAGGFPSTLSSYITQPLTGAAVGLPEALEPEDPALASAEGQLRAALDTIHDQLGAATEPAVVDGLLEAAMALYVSYAALADKA